MCCIYNAGSMFFTKSQPLIIRNEIKSNGLQVTGGELQGHRVIRAANGAGILESLLQNNLRLDLQNTCQPGPLGMQGVSQTGFS